MNKYLLQIIIFCLVALLLLSPFIITTLLTNDGTDFDKIIEMQRNNEKETIIGMGYGEVNNEYLKMTNVNYYKPEIITIGASVCMQYKDFFFNTSFYNTGRSSYLFSQYSNFLSHINDDALPKIIILDLSHRNFNREEIDEQYPIIKTDYSVVESLKFNKINPLRLMLNCSHYMTVCDNRLGSAALFQDSGFLQDGSYYYGNVYKDYGKNIEDIKISVDNEDFVWLTESPDIDPSALESLDRFLSLCDEKDIFVIGSIPPIAVSVLPYIENHKDDTCRYVYQIYPEAKKIFDKYGYEIYDYTDLRSFEIDDSYFVNWIHGGEVSFLRMVIDMDERGSILNEYTDLSYLKTLYENRFSNLTVYSLDWLYC